MKIFLSTILAFAMPAAALAAEEGFVTRRDGYLLIWSAINRPAYETRHVFQDVSYDEKGGLEINYSRRRGILDKVDRFNADDPLIMEDALLWLYRTRNVDELPSMQREHLPAMMDRYPILEEGSQLEDIVTSTDQLVRMALSLDTQLQEEVHLVSYYADDFHGNGTAFGETFDMHDITAAHRSFPHNTLVRVTNIENRKSIVVRINDRGPYKYGRDIDLSLAAFQKIAPLSRGVISATFKRLGDKDLLGKCENPLERRYQKRITRNVRFHRGVPHTFGTGQELVLAANKYFVVRGITYPDGTKVRIQDYVGPKEKFRFKASMPGFYTFLVGTKEGRRRDMTMMVSECG